METGLSPPSPAKLMVLTVNQGQDRAQRLNERLRGAGYVIFSTCVFHAPSNSIHSRADVGSDDFNLDIEGIGEPFTQQSSSSPPAARPSAAAQYSPEIPPAPSESNEPVSSPNRTRPPPSSPRRPAPYHEEITESPVHAPGSGHRRRVPVQEASATAARMMTALQSDPIQPISLPSLNRPSRHSQDPTPPRKTASPAIPPSDESQNESEDAALMPPPPPRVPRPVQRPPPARSPVQESPSAEEEEAEEIGDGAAAAAIGRKRPRVSFQPSPELGSEESDIAEPAEEHPAPKRPRPLQQQQPPRREPAVQRQPKRRNAAEGQNKKRGRPRGQGSASAPPRAADDDNVIEITVQRFVNGPEVESDEDAPQQGGEMGFANRSGETVVDVFAQVCEEVIAATLTKYEYLRQETQDEDKKKDCRIKMRAIEAFREEVSAQLLQHVCSIE